MQPMRGNSRTLTSSYSLKIKNDSVFSNLPYFGVAYSLTIFPNGSASINVLPTNRQSISFTGDMETKE